MNSIIVWPDMSSKLRFQVHYSDGYISHDAYEVDLSAFERRVIMIVSNIFLTDYKMCHDLKKYTTFFFGP